MNTDDTDFLGGSSNPNYECTVDTHAPLHPKQSRLVVTPNPTNAFALIQFPPTTNHPDKGTLKLLTATGALAAHFQHTHDALRVDLSGMPPGLYFLVDGLGNWGKLIVD